MHELSIARSILNIVKEQLDSHLDCAPGLECTSVSEVAAVAGVPGAPEVVGVSGPASVRRITVRAGKLNAIIPASLQFYFDVLKKEDQRLATAILVLEHAPVVARCPACKTDFELAEPVFLCPTCGGPADLLSGMELVIESFELDDT